MSFSSWLRYLYGHSRNAGGKSSRHRNASHNTIRRSCPYVEILEDRTLLSAYMVTTTADTGPGSLRDAINQINIDTGHVLYASVSDPTKDEIDFQIGTGLQLSRHFLLCRQS